MFAIVVVAALSLVAAVVLIAWRQERIVFQPPSPAGAGAVNCPSVSYVGSDGQKLIAYVVGAPSGTFGIIIAFHGNAVEARDLIPWAREVHDRTGWCVFLPEYRGYAGLEGSPSYGNSKLDARAAYEAAIGLAQPTVQPIVIFGHSIGSAIATELAADTRPFALVLQSPLTSARDMARIVIARPLDLLWTRISRVHYDTESLVHSLDVPVWVAHGARDMITPVAMGRRVHSAALRKGSLLIVRSAAHNDVPERGNSEYWNWLVAAVGSQQQ